MRWIEVYNFEENVGGKTNLMRRGRKQVTRRRKRERNVDKFVSNEKK